MSYKKVLYLMCNELIVNHGIFQTQVKSLLTTMSRKYGNAYQIHFLCFTPIIRFRKWYVEVVFSKYKTDFKSIGNEFKENNIHFNVKPLLASYPFLSMKFLEMLFLVPGAFFRLLLYIKKHHIDFLHCRSYPAGLLSLLVKLTLGIPYIFDPRSLWIEEQILTHSWKRGSLTHKFWLFLQHHIVSNAKVTVVVSDTMASYYQHITPNIKIIYTTASSAFFSPLPPQISDYERTQLQVLKQMRQNYTLLVFSTNRFNQWNNLDYLLQKYKFLRDFVPNPKLILISRTPKNTISRAVEAHNIPIEEVWVEKFTVKTMKTALSQCHYGLLVRPNMPSVPFMNSIMSVKFAEYLASGLPVISEVHLGGAAHIINRYQVGMIVTDNKLDNQKRFNLLSSNYIQTSQICKNIAKTLFSIDVHVKQYEALYRDMV